MFPSIKLRLVAWFLSVFSLLFAFLGFFLYYELKAIVIGSVDDHLHSEVQLIAGLLDVEEGYHEVELSEAEVGEYALPLSGHYYQVIDSKGEIIVRSPSLSIVDAKLPAAATQLLHPVYDTIIGPDRGPLRTLSQTFELTSGVITIQAGETLEEAYNLLETFKYMILILFPSFFIISAFGIVIITRLSLGRLDSFSEKVGRITERSLNERLEEEGVEAELKPLASGFNSMMKRIEESFERQRQFLSDASHDLRTPTSVIKSHCDVILKKGRTPEEYIETLQKIGKTSERMSRIINRILEAARLDSEIFSLSISDVDLLALVGDVRNSLATKAEEKSVKTTVCGDNLKLKGDSERLFEAFTGILDNAIIYNKEGGSVDIDVSLKNGEAVVTISDTGTGIPGEDIDKIFDRFYRVDKSRGIVEGAGLGLSIAKAIVEAHNGRIDIDSEVEKGTTLTVYLPIA